MNVLSTTDLPDRAQRTTELFDQIHDVADDEERHRLLEEVIRLNLGVAQSVSLR